MTSVKVRGVKVKFLSLGTGGAGGEGGTGGGVGGAGWTPR